MRKCRKRGDAFAGTVWLFSMFFPPRWQGVLERTGGAVFVFGCHVLRVSPGACNSFIDEETSHATACVQEY